MHPRAVALSVAACLAVPAVAAHAADNRAFTSKFPLAQCRLRTTGSNPYLILRPGRQVRLTNERCVAAGDCDESVVLVITVLDERRTVRLKIGGELRSVMTRVVEERETVNGVLAEVSRNFLAQCEQTRDVYYFGEDVDIFENGEVSHEGSWLAGKNGARPGLLMPGGAFLLGSRYFQEVAPRVALDRAEHVAMNLTIRVPAGRFRSCVEIQETTPLEPGVSSKKYCRGVGLVIDGDLQLAEIVRR
jgi:hypothetical protein